MLFGHGFVLLGFLAMLLLWKQGIPYWKVGLGYALVGIGVGLAGTPTSNSLTGSVPVKRVGMASGTADLQRDLGGAIMQSIFGALLTAGYAAAAGAQISCVGHERLAGSPGRAHQVVLERGRSPSSTRSTRAIITGAQEAFLKGDKWAYARGNHRGAASAPRSSPCASRTRISRNSCSANTRARKRSRPAAAAA